MLIVYSKDLNLKRWCKLFMNIFTLRLKKIICTYTYLCFSFFNYHVSILFMEHLLSPYNTSSFNSHMRSIIADRFEPLGLIYKLLTLLFRRTVFTAISSWLWWIVLLPWCSAVIMTTKQVTRSSCGWADCVMDLHTTGPGSSPSGYGTLSTKLPTDYHHSSIIKLSVCWCVWKVVGGFLNRVLPYRVDVYSSVTFHING